MRGKEQPFISRFLLKVKIFNLYLIQQTYSWEVKLESKVDQPIACKRRRVLQLAAAVVMLGLIGTTVWSLNSYRQAQAEVVRLSSLEGQQEVVRQEADVLLEQVRAHLILPEDEEPTIATISDVEVLVEQQPFFEGAQNGDKVLVYVQARKAIIYSPERDVVVNVGAVIVDESLIAQNEIDEVTEPELSRGERSDQVENELDEATEAGSGRGNDMLQPSPAVKKQISSTADSQVLGDRSKSNKTETSVSGEQEQSEGDFAVTE